jgi:hypothetical protein
VIRSYNLKAGQLLKTVRSYNFFIIKYTHIYILKQITFIHKTGGNGIKATGKYFDTSFGYSEIMFEKKFTEIFDEKVISEIRGKIINHF